jgi:hypothetical protein
MPIQSSVSASCIQLMPLRHKFKVFAHLAERTTIQMQHATHFSAGFTVLRGDMQKLRVWREQKRPRWSVNERLLLIATMPREGTTVISDLITLMSAFLTLLRCLVTGSLHGEIQLCQK